MCAGCNPSYSMARADRRDHMVQRYVVISNTSRMETNPEESYRQAA